jgi:hypothetical protein
MITCESCRSENWDGAQFCDECGKSLPRPASAGGTAAVPGFRQPSSEAGARPDASTTQPGVAGDHGHPAPVVFPEPKPVTTTVAGGARPAAAGASSGLATAHAVLTINRGHSAGREFPVHEDEAYIGRWDADSGIFPDVDLDADDPEAKVSRRHARITRRAGQYFIEDLGSTNGTFVNRGRRLVPGDRLPLKDGDEIIIGKTFLQFRVMK